MLGGSQLFLERDSLLKARTNTALEWSFSGFDDEPSRSTKSLYNSTLFSIGERKIDSRYTFTKTCVYEIL